MNDLVCIAAIIGAHGIRGEVKIKSFASPSQNIKNYNLLYDADEKEYQIIWRSMNDDVAIAAIEGVKDRNIAETLKSLKLHISREKLPDIDEDEFYYEDLVGLEVVNLTDNSSFGKVIGVHNFGASDLLEIGIDPKNTQFYEFNEYNFPEIDFDKNMIFIDPPKHT